MKKLPLIAAAFAVVCLFVVVPHAQDPAPKKDSTTEAAPVDYLVLCADGLVDVANEWAKYRTGHGRVTQVMPLSTIKTAQEREYPALTDIKSAILEVAGGEQLTPGFQVLLLGDCPNDSATVYDGKVEIPWFLTSQMDSNPEPARRERVPTDNFYADLVQDDDGLPDIGLGRIPARTPEQARLALKKVQAYEAALQGEWLRNLTFFAGEGRFGAVVDALLERIFTQFAEKIAQAYAVRMTYANIASPYAYSPSKLSSKVIEEANAGALLLTYLGHGSHDRLDDMYVDIDGKQVRYPILTSDDVGNFNIPDGKLPVMMIVACETGHMDHGKGCLAEKICFTEKAPVAIIASSRDSHPYSNTLLQKAMVQELTGTLPPTLGAAFMNAKRELILAKDPDRKMLDGMTVLFLNKDQRAELNRSHLSLYNLAGDPGLRMQYPKIELGAQPMLGQMGATDKFDLELSSMQPLANLEYEVWIECRRSTLAKPVKPFTKADLASPDAEKRAAAEAIIAENHASANTKRVTGATMKESEATELRDPEDEKRVLVYSVTLSGKLDSPLAPGDYILKVFARDSKNNRCGFAAAELKISK